MASSNYYFFFFKSAISIRRIEWCHVEPPISEQSIDYQVTLFKSHFANGWLMIHKLWRIAQYSLYINLRHRHNLSHKGLCHNRYGHNLWSISYGYIRNGHLIAECQLGQFVSERLLCQIHITFWTLNLGVNWYVQKCPVLS